MVEDYADHADYIAALKQNICLSSHHHLLISFHGILERSLCTKRQPYQMRCENTPNALAAALGLKNEEWTLCYQSQFGYDTWLKPSTQTLLRTLPKKNIKNIAVMCPGFTIDCLETLEEIALCDAADFKTAGGESSVYLPILNASHHHINFLYQLIKEISISHPL